MGLPIIQVTCNWNQIGGCKLAESVRCDVNQEGVFTKPPLAEIIGTENAILLKQNDIKEPCEFHIKWQPTPYKMKAVSIASTVQRLMLYLGPQKEYTRIYVAEELEDIDEGEGMLFTYRHDITIEKSDITELVLKMLPSSDEICIFGVVLQIGLNTKDIDLTNETHEDVTVEPTCNWSKSAQSILSALRYLTAKETGKLGIEQAQSTFDIDLANENHEDVTVQATCNWKRTEDCELSQHVRCEVTHEFVFIPPALNTIVKSKNAIFLQRDDNSKEPCEVHFKLQTSYYKIESISIVSSVAKIEVFLGPLNEYTDTFHSSALENSCEDKVCTYRHDIEVRKSGIIEVMLKLISTSPEIFIFGTLLQIAPNPNGITTGSNIDFDKLLSSQPANCPRKEACMLFLEKIAKKQDLANKNQLSASEAIAVTSPALDNALKTYLDHRFEQLELKINERLDKAIAEQNAKLDKILDMLVQKTIV